MTALEMLGHPAADSFNHALAATIAQVWQDTGHDTTLHDLTAQGFDPRLTAAEARGEPTQDPLVQRHIADLRACDLLAIVHPNCWGAPPAIMKGWIDRVFAPNAAYAFAKGSDQGDAPVGLLRARAALVINTGNTAPSREAAVFGDPLDAMWRQCILGYCGIGKITRRLFGVIATSTMADRAAWLVETQELANEIAQMEALS